MAAHPIFQNAPQVQHSFEGDVKVLNATFDQRVDIRKIFTAMIQEIQKVEGRPVQVSADVKLRIGGGDAKEHVYTVSVTDPSFDAEAFARMAPPPKATPNPQPIEPPSRAPKPPIGANGLQRTPQQATSPTKTPDDDDVVEVTRPHKRPRLEDDRAVSHTEVSDQLQIEKLFSFVKDWHLEWVRQGGWLFDNLPTTNSTSVSNQAELVKKMDIVQDVLGQSVNSATSSMMTELANITKLLPWLEHCRKTSADSIQAREEKWRTSSATFHDQTRKDREAAEKRIEKKLEEQRTLLLKIARVNGVDLDEVAMPDASREASLGAQLTAELNMEAAKSGNGSRRETINIDDDS